MSDKQQNTAEGDRVLVICNDIERGAAISRPFQANGFPVRVHRHDAGEIDSDAYGAVVHVEASNAGLVKLLGRELPFVKDEEWLLIESDGDDANHCTVQLGPQASSRLRELVRTLWAQFNIT